MALAGRFRTVREDMAEMSAAIGAVHFGSGIAQLEIRRGADRAGQRLPETRPARAGIEFRFRTVERVVATSAGEGPRPVLVVQWGRIGALGRRIAQDVELAPGQLLAPLRLGQFDRKALGLCPARPAGGECGKAGGRADPAQQAAAGGTDITFGHNLHLARAA